MTISIAIEFLANTTSALTGIAGLDKGISGLGGRIQSVGMGISGFGQSLLPASLAIGAALGVATSKAFEFEKAMAGTTRAIGLSREESAKFGKDLQALAPTVGLTAKELASVADATAKAGVEGIANIKAVTETVAKSAVLLDLPADQVAESLGKISSVYNLTGKEIDVLAGKFNYLGDTIGGKESDMMKVVAASGATAASARLTAAQVAAMAATYSRLGVEAGVAANSIKAQFSSILTASTGKSKQYNEVLKSIGLTSQQLATILQQPNGAVNAVLLLNERMGKLKGAAQAIALSTFYGNNYNDTIGLAVNRTDLLAKAFKNAGDDAAATAKAQKEWNTVTESTSFQMQAAKASLENIAITFGQAVLPAVNSLLGVVTPLVAKFADFASANPQIVKVGVAIAGIAAVAAPVVIGVGAMVAAFGAIAPIAGTIAAVTAAVAATAAGITVLVRVTQSAIPAMAAGWNNLRNFASSATKGIYTAFTSINWSGIGSWIGSQVGNAIAAAKNIWHWAGQMLVYAFSQGLQSFFATPINMVKNLVAQIRAYLPGSDAKVGALSDLTASGAALPKTFAAGIASASSTPVITTAQTTSRVAGALPSSGVSPIGASGSSVNNITLNITVTGSNPDAVVDAIKKRIRDVVSVLDKERTGQARPKLA